VDVDHEAGARIGLAVDHAPAGAAREQWIAQAPRCRRLGASTGPAVVARGVRIAIEHARAQGRGRIGERRGERPAFVDERDQLAGADLARWAERAIVDPGMAGADAVAQRLGDAPARAHYFSVTAVSWYSCA